MAPHRSMTFPLAVAALWGLILASSARAQPGARPASGTWPQEQAASQSFPGPLPATFVGDLPCADCPGIRHTIVLHPDHAFVYRMTYLGRGEGGKGDDFDDVGRWSLSADGRTLTLAGGREQPVMFAVQSADTLRKLDESGRPIQSALNYDLTRVAGAAAVEPKKLSLDGTSWQLTSASIPVTLAGDPARATLKFTSGRMSASSGCNTGAGSYSLEGKALAIGPLASTRMACPPALAAWEDAFFEFLAARPAASREGDELVLTSIGGALRFRPVPVPGANAVQKFVYVAAARKPCSGVGPMECLQVRERPSDPWQLHYGEIVGFTHVPGTEYRLRIWEDDGPRPPADGSSKRWLLDLVVEQRVIEKQGR